MEAFDIIEYLSGLTGFVFDKAVLKRVAIERGVIGVTEYTQLDQKTKELLLADLLMVVYLSPNTSASHTNQHGSFTVTVGSQTINSKDAIYDVMMRIYKKYGDANTDCVPESSNTMVWME
jgi:hypothetical protein